MALDTHRRGPAIIRMDNYWLAAGGNPQVCRLDGLTYAWYTDRLRAKLNR